MTSITAGLYASDWAQFAEAVRSAREELGSPEALWFRGHASVDYILKPSLLRLKNWQIKEQSLFEDYERYSFLRAGEKNVWEVLQDMQQYGIPTRLLDWTQVLGIAVGFALFDRNDDGRDSCVYLLDPRKLNERSGLTGVKRTVGDDAFRYKDVYWNGVPFSPTLPIAIDGRLHSDRLRAQSGTFTVHGRDERPLDEQAPDVVKRITIGANAKTQMREVLEFADITPLRIYPDSIGMARYLISKHFPQLP